MYFKHSTNAKAEEVEECIVGSATDSVHSVEVASGEGLRLFQVVLQGLNSTVKCGSRR